MANNQKVCRACLSQTEPLKDLFSVCTPEIFKYCTSVEISHHDSLPKVVCYSCIDMLNKVYYFKQVVIRSNTVLRQQCSADVKPEGYTENVDILSVIDNELPTNSHTSTRSIETLYPQGVHNITNSNIIEIGPTAHQSYEEEVKSEGGPTLCNLVPVKTSQIMHEAANTDSLPPDLDAQASNFDVNQSIIIEVRGRGRPRKKPKKQRVRMKCVKCEKTFQKYENLEAHMRGHFGKKPDIRCEQCDKTFPTLRNLHCHMRTHSKERRYTCATCAKSFAYLAALKNHELTHTGVKNHACHICSMRFYQAYNLKKHIETHKNERNFTCDLCGKKFAQPGNLKIHLVRHTGVKKFACHMCDMRFYIKADLDKHMLTHSDDKPYGCELCDKRFKSKPFLAIHMRTHTGERPFPCDICPKRFMARKDLRNHRMIHTGEKPHKCSLCNQAFIQKCALNRHMKSHGKHTEDTQNIPRPPPMQVANIAPLSMTYTHTQWHTNT